MNSVHAVFAHVDCENSLENENIFWFVLSDIIPVFQGMKPNNKYNDNNVYNLMSQGRF